MTAILNRDDIPSHLFRIPELDFSEDLCAERSGGLWFRLGAWTVGSPRNAHGVEDVVSRQSLLLDPGCFADIYDNLELIGNVIGQLGKPGSMVSYADGQGEHRYAPFYRFELPRTSAIGEPLVFVHSTPSGSRLLINPDLWLLFQLEEKNAGSGIWWDQSRGVEALRQRVLAQDNLEIVEIRTAYLLSYLQARQRSLIVGHYRHLYLFDASPSTKEMFVEENVTLGSADQRAKAIMQNWKIKQDVTGFLPSLCRSLHLWCEVRPPEIDAADPWADRLPFDPCAFTLPTRVGPVAPARWTSFHPGQGRDFEGVACDYMEWVYFRQEVLAKYEGSCGFEVGDNGTVECRGYWGLYRGTWRIGNELLSTHIGDFTEGIPFEEWLHWGQYAVEPPDGETVAAL